MRDSPKRNRIHARCGAPLYAVVFQSALSTFIISLLFISFLLQPVHEVYAQEPDTPEEPAATTVAESVKPDSTVDSLANAPPLSTEESANTSDTTTDNTKPAEPDTDTEVVSSASADDEQTTESSLPPDQTAPDTTKEEGVDSDGISPETAIQEQSESGPSASSGVAIISGSEETRSGNATDGGELFIDDPPPNGVEGDPSPASTSSASTTSLDERGLNASSSDRQNAGSASGAVDSSTATSGVPADTVTSGGSASNGVEDTPATSTTATSPDSEQSSEQPNPDGEQDGDVIKPSATPPGDIATSGPISLPTNEQVTQVTTLITDDNYYQFSKQSCVPVGDGAYHCSVNDKPIVDTQSVVMSDIGESGNAEIFIRTAKGSVEQITDNLYDDTAPHYDPDSGQIVWQRLINDRYQIILYSISEQKETQLTFSRTNNMEPAVSSAGVVWQAWDNNDWEIMFFDGELSDQLTDNQAQDLNPVLEDEYVIWSVIGDGAQYAQVYSLDSKEIMTITNHEGGSIVNPRFVLVYDTQFDNGDIITQGFDPETGFVEPLSAKPAPEPIDLPDPDPIGEVRAIIQNKSTSKETTGLPTDTDDDPPAGGPDVSSSHAATSSDELNLKSIAASSTSATDTKSATSSADTSVPGGSFIELDEFDLVIPFEDTTSSGDDTESNTSTSSQVL